jgi:hypothetical protein
MRRLRTGVEQALAMAVFPVKMPASRHTAGFRRASDDVIATAQLKCVQPTEVLGSLCQMSWNDAFRGKPSPRSIARVRSFPIFLSQTFRVLSCEAETARAPSTVMATSSNRWRDTNLRVQPDLTRIDLDYETPENRRGTGVGNGRFPG